MELVFATSLWSRLAGLLIKKRCSHSEVLVLAPCRSIHSFGMTCPLDIAFLDAEGRVLASERDLPRNQTRSCRKASVVLERRSAQERYWPKRGEQLCLRFHAEVHKREEKVDEDL